MAHQDLVEKNLKQLFCCLERIHDIKSALNYAELVSEIETCLSFDVVKNIFECIIYDPEVGADILGYLKDTLVYLRDDKNEELKAMFTEESSIPAPIIFYLLKTMIEIHRIVLCFIDTYIRKCYNNNPIGNARVYPYLFLLGDVVDVIAY